jgi:hypothetical protein
MHPFLTVVDAFAIERIGLVLAPDLPIPATERKAPTRSTVRVELLDGTTRDIEARFETLHTSPGGFKRVVVLPLEWRGSVGAGSRVWGDAMLMEMLDVPTHSRCRR